MDYMAFARELGGTIASILAPVVLLYLQRWLSHKAGETKDKRKRDADVTRGTLAREGVRLIVAGVEEWSARQAKQGSKPNSEAKLQEAMARIRTHVPGITEVDMGHMIDEEVARLDGCGSTGKSVDLLTKPGNQA